MCKERLHSPELMDTLPNEASAWFESPDDVAEGLADGAIRAARLERLRVAISKLPTGNMEEAMLLRFFEGKTFREIAVIQGCSAVMVCKRVRSGVEVLRTEFSDDG